MDSTPTLGGIDSRDAALASPDADAPRVSRTLSFSEAGGGEMLRPLPAAAPAADTYAAELEAKEASGAKLRAFVAELGSCAELGGRKLGSGQFGTVRRVEHRDAPSRSLVVKEVKRGAPTGPGNDLRREFAAQCVAHSLFPEMVPQPVAHLVCEDGTQRFIMESLPSGTTFVEAMESGADFLRADGDAWLHLWAAVHDVETFAVRFAEAGYVHGDLNARNVFLADCACGCRLGGAFNAKFCVCAEGCAGHRTHVIDFGFTSATAGGADAVTRDVAALVRVFSMSALRYLSRLGLRLRDDEHFSAHWMAGCLIDGMVPELRSTPAHYLSQLGGERYAALLRENEAQRRARLEPLGLRAPVGVERAARGRLLYRPEGRPSLPARLAGEGSGARRGSSSFKVVDGAWKRN